MYLDLTKLYFSALILMAGIILVTKPPFLFPPQVNSNGTNSLFRDYLDRNYVMYNLNSKYYYFTRIKVDLCKLEPFEFVFSDVNSTFDVIQDAEEGDLYFVGAIIALSSAIFSAANNIVVAKIVSVFIRIMSNKPNITKNPILSFLHILHITIYMYLQIQH